jgi:hypothetical protein
MEENHDKIQSVYSVFRAGYETGTSQLQIRGVAASGDIGRVCNGQNAELKV